MERMDKEKQIEEMANIINEMDDPNAHYYDENLEQHEAFADCFTIAKHLYEQGYRKFSKSELDKKIQELTLKSMDLRIHQHFDKEFAKMIMRKEDEGK